MITVIWVTKGISHRTEPHTIPLLLVVTATVVLIHLRKKVRTYKRQESSVFGLDPILMLTYFHLSKTWGASSILQHHLKFIETHHGCGENYGPHLFSIFNALRSFPQLTPQFWKHGHTKFTLNCFSSPKISLSYSIHHGRACHTLTNGLAVSDVFGQFRSQFTLNKSWNKGCWNGRCGSLGIMVWIIQT